MYFQPLWLTVHCLSRQKETLILWLWISSKSKTYGLLDVWLYVICIFWAPCCLLRGKHLSQYSAITTCGKTGIMWMVKCIYKQILKNFMTLKFVKTWRLRLSLYQEIILVCEQCVDVCHCGKNCYLCTAMAWEKEFRTDRMSEQTC